MQTIFDLNPTTFDLDVSNYSYQNNLTYHLDQIESDFDQSTIDEIVLWKLNRYVEIDRFTLELINKINKKDTIVDAALTGNILLRLLQKEQKGVRIAMATTILRFKNPHIYQILDQRVYRFIYGKTMDCQPANINLQIVIYLNYLVKLTEVCKEYNIKFEDSDRILYKMDKLYNKDLPLIGY